MRFGSGSHNCPIALLMVLGASALSLAIVSSVGLASADETKSPYPWTSAQTVQPGELASELVRKTSEAPIVVYVGFRTLFAGGHIPGASFHGSASTELGMAELKKWADPLSRSTELVIYCGCCPFDKCPNIRPAFNAFDKMSFKRIRVLILPNSFASDWADKGYPMQKGL
jgi:thiosulfate/3-mercaptopyruvate sulfurtransferase